MEMWKDLSREKLLEGISQLQKELEDLREIEARYRFMVDHQGEGIGIVDENETFTFANPAACEIFGFPDGKLTGHNLREFVSPEAYENIIQQTDLRKQGSSSRYEVHLTRPDGSPRHIWITATPVYKKEKFSGTLGIFFDVTEHLRSEEVIRQNESRLRAITDSTHDAIIMMDDEGNISFWNPAAEHILGYHSKEALGKNLHDFLVPERYLPKHRAAFSLFRKTGQGQAVGQTMELAARRKDGKEIPVALSLSAVSVGNNWHAVGILRDITIQKTHEQELQDALQRAETVNKLKSAFIYTISHEVRTPLNGILGFSQLISDPAASAEERSQYSALLKGSSERLINTITNYIDISMLSSGNMEVTVKKTDPVELLRLLFKQFQPICRETGVALVLDLPPLSGPLFLETDPELIRKALRHLLDNAVKFTHQGEIRIGLEIREGDLGFFVSDTGVGIGEEARDRVFHTFVQEELSLTRGYEGSGLGLSIANGIINLLGGRIDLASEKGQGTRFTCVLPVQHTDKQIFAESVPSSKSLSGVKPVVLVAEDDEANQIFIRTVLTRANAELLTVSNGRDAVEQCRANPMINLVLMDLKMPEMDGYEATRLIKKFRPDLPVIAVTAFAMSGDRKRAQDAGCDDYLAKPVTREALLGKLTGFGFSLNAISPDQ